jgi:flagellar motor switch protein FliN
MSEPLTENAQWLMEHWAAALAGAVESMTEQRPETQWTAEAADAGAAGAEDLSAGTICWQQFFKGIEQAAMWVTAPEKTWTEIGGRTLRAAGIESAEPADARNTYLEVLSQSLAGVAQTIGARLAREVDCEKGGECPRAASAEHRFAVLIRYPDVELALAVCLNPALVAALQPRESKDASAAGVAPSDLRSAVGNAPAATADRSSAPEIPATGSRTMDLLLDVELPVSVSFGRAELPIKELLKLTTGSIVELNRAVSEPVEVIVNNCVIARGEVVVVEGNYGVRINQILSRQDRLRSLK